MPQVFPYDKLILSCGPWTNMMLAKGGMSLLPAVVSCEQGEYYQCGAGPHIMDYLPTRWIESPRTVIKRAPSSTKWP